MMTGTRALKFGFEWVHCNGETSKSSAILAWYHPVWSITWRWGIYWSRRFAWKITNWRGPGGYGQFYVPMLWLGSLGVSWQPTMLRKP